MRRHALAGPGPAAAPALQAAALTALLLAACRPSDTVPLAVEVTERDSAGIAVVQIDGSVQHLPERGLEAEPELVMDGSQPPFFSSIGEVEWLSDGRLVVEDNQHDALYLFAADGTYLRQLGAKGDGPGEFQNVTELTVLPGDSVYAFDRTHDRLSVLHPDQGFVRSVQFGRTFAGRPPLDVFALAPDRVLVQATVYADPSDARLPRRADTDAHLYLTDALGASLTGPVVFSQGFSVLTETADGPHPYSHRAIVAVAAGRLVHGSGERYEVTVRDGDLDAHRMIRWTGWSAPITEAEVTELRRKTDSVRAETDPGWPAEVWEMLRAQDEAAYSPEVMPVRRPALDWRSYVDETGRIWLKRFEVSPLLGEAPEWHVLSPEGRPLFRLTLPVAATLAAVRDDRLTLIVRDALDVESLAVYRIVE